ncbi:MAG: hypothetical protein IJ584_16770, partial [Bacteroidales bacterium]|nr:hypothetical protein [Bacteroidales bacterium]
MLPFIVYEGKVALAIAAFYLFWRLLLRKETFHRLNRGILVGTVILSFILPFVIITVKKSVDAVPYPIEEEAPAAILSTEGGMASPLAESLPWWQSAIAVIYVIGLVSVLGRILLSLLSIRKLLGRSSLISTDDGIRFFVGENDIDPFSWMNNIVISNKDYGGNHQSIIAHEKAHIRCGHSAELLL